MFGVVLVVLGLSSSCFGVVSVFSGDEEPPIPLTEALGRSGELVRIEGRLHAAAPVTMPDDGTPAIRGRLFVALRRSGARNVPDDYRDVFHDWEADATGVVLTDGENELAVDATLLPRPEDRDARGSVEHTTRRGGQPVRASYGSESWELDSEQYENSRWSLAVEREQLAQDQPVVITGIPAAGRLGPGPGGRLLVDLGTAESVSRSQARTRIVMLVLGPLLLFAGLGLTVVMTILMMRARAAGAGRIAGALTGR